MIFLAGAPGCRKMDLMRWIIIHSDYIPIYTYTTKKQRMDDHFYKYVDERNFLQMVEDETIAAYTKYKIGRKYIYFGLRKEDILLDYDHRIGIAFPEYMDGIKSCTHDYALIYMWVCPQSAQIHEYAKKHGHLAGMKLEKLLWDNIDETDDFISDSDIHLCNNDLRASSQMLWNEIQYHAQKEGIIL
jgi:guanylate kinase